MLPSFRLIAATFLCGFVVMFAGLRLAASLNDFHEGLPVMAAQAAPVAIADVDDQRGGSTPVMYDWRFAVRAASQAPAPINVTALVIDRAAPLDVGPQLSVAPPEAAAKEANTAVTPPAETPDPEMAKPAGVVATISPEPSAPADTPAVPAPVDPPQAAPAVAAVELQAPAAVESTPAAADISSASAAAPAAADASPAPAGDPLQNAPAATPQIAPAVKSAPRAAIRKKRIRLAQRQAPANAAAGFNSTAISSFNAPH